MHYVHKKARCGPEIATFRTKTLHFLLVIRLNWLAKIELRGVRSPWSSILLLAEVESMTQVSRPTPRTAFPRTDPIEAKDRNARGQGPRTQPRVFSKKKGIQKSFSGNLQFIGVTKDCSTVRYVQNLRTTYLAP